MKKAIKYRFLSGLIITGILIGLSSCQKKTWDDHYDSYPQSVNMKLMDALKKNPEYSLFLTYMQQTGLDSLLTSNEAKTLFVPTNTAFEELSPEDTVNYLEEIIAYHISPTVFLSNNVEDLRKLLSNTGKYLSIEKKDKGNIVVDDVPVNFSSPLYLDGKYYELPKVLIPPPNIYSYMKLHCPVLKRYVDQFDTLYLDLSKSIPLGYNDQGEIIYDSVYVESNIFEETVFPISKEFRNRTATVILFSQEQYDEALEVMASKMGIDVSDIPLTWQNERLIPSVLRSSFFEGSLEYEDFYPELKNILGDTSFIDPSTIDPDSRFRCSNGIVFKYLDFKVPEDLYLEKRMFEAEQYIDALGLGHYIWDPEYVRFYSTIPTEPMASETDQASNDTLVSVTYQFDYTGEYWIEFTLDNVFPGDYILEWRGNYRPSGSFKVYVDSVDVTATSPMAPSGTFDTYRFRNVIYSVVEGNVYIPDRDRNNSVDFLVKDIIKEYGNITVRIEYQNAGSQSNNGLSIDYLALTPIIH